MKRAMQDAYDLVLMLLDTARYSEIANIEWSRIHMHERMIHLWRPKVQNEAILYMTDRVFDILNRRSKLSGKYVFHNKQGGGYASLAIRGRCERRGWRTARSTPCAIHMRLGRTE